MAPRQAKHEAFAGLRSMITIPIVVALIGAVAIAYSAHTTDSSTIAAEGN